MKGNLIFLYLFSTNFFLVVLSFYGPAKEPRNKTISDYAFELKASKSIKDVSKEMKKYYSYSLNYILEVMKYKHEHNTLWLEFGVFSGTSINYISKFTSLHVYGFDSFEGLPETWRPGYEKSDFDLKGVFPAVNENVRLIKGWYDKSLPPFLTKHSEKKVSFLHIDCDLYSSTIFVLRILAENNQFARDCVIEFDELFNYDGFDGNKGELRAWYDFTHEYNVSFSWIGMGSEIDLVGHRVSEEGHPYATGEQPCALIVHSVSKTASTSTDHNDDV